LLRRYLTLWLALSSAAALWWPELCAWGGVPTEWDPFLAARRTIAAAIFVTMFCIGGLLPAEEVRRLPRQALSVLYGTTVQYVTMPLLAWLAVWLWGLTGDLRMGVLIVGCVPGAMASNVLTLAAGGNVSYSVGLTTSATLLSPLVVPLALKLTGGETISAGMLLRISLELLWLVVLPVVAGFVLCRWSHRAAALLARSGEPIANLAILWIIAVVVGVQRMLLRSTGTETLLATIGTALLAVNLAGYLAGYLSGAAGGLDERRRRALTIEVGMQNAGVGTQLALSVLGEQTTATIPTALYTFGCMLTGTLLAQVFARLRQEKSFAETSSG
jgi:BASS family bile acid:Na+ symporter